MTERSLVCTLEKNKPSGNLFIQWSKDDTNLKIKGAVGPGSQ
jgi:hypothetical protein